MNQSSPAARLSPHQRQKIALRVLTRQEPISGIADEEGVSRKFLYKQGHIAQNALHLAFEKPKAESEVLFYLPVTQKWLSGVDFSSDSHLSLFIPRSSRVIEGYVRLFPQYRDD